MLRFLCAWSLVWVVRARTDNSSGFEVIHNPDNRTVDSETCKYQPCLTKCCQRKQILLYNDTDYTQSCVDNILSTNLENYTNIDIYGKDIGRNIIKTNKTFRDFTIIYNDTLDLESMMIINGFFYNTDKSLHLMEDGTIAVRKVNVVRQWDYIADKNNNFCVDLTADTAAASLGTTNSSNLRLVILLHLEPIEDEFDDNFLDNNLEFIGRMYGSTAKLVSCFFLLLVLAAYAVLPQKRNLPSIMQMAYLASLASAFITELFMTYSLETQEYQECKVWGLLKYYCTLASCTWINVMSFDLWWSVSRSIPHHRVSRREALEKFCWYSIYGFLVPALLILFIVIVDLLDLTHVPNFVKPFDIFKCYMTGDERQVYENGPLLFTTVIDVVLFVMTASSIWWTRRIQTGGATTNNKLKHKFFIYFKLAMFMGMYHWLSWGLDVGIHFKFDSPWIEYVMFVQSTLNALIGPFMFIVFACKKSMFVLLCKRFSFDNTLVRKWDTSNAAALQG